MIIHAIKIGGAWFVAVKVEAETYGDALAGDDPTRLVWCERKTTAYLGEIGQEEACVDLEKVPA